MPGLNGFDRAAGKEDRLHAKRFDAWFRSLPKVQQEELRAEGVVPYAEAKSHDHVFPIYERAAIWAYNPNEERIEQESFIAREQVGRIVADVVDMLGYTDDPHVRRHWELMRLVLRAPGHLNGKQVGDLFGVTKQAISAQAIKMLARVDRRASIARGLQIEANTAVFEADQHPPSKESFRPPDRQTRGGTPPAKKNGGFGRFSRVGKKAKKNLKSKHAKD